MILSKKELHFYILADRIMAKGSAQFSWKERLKNIVLPDYILNYLYSMRQVAYYVNTGRKNKGLLAILYHKWNYRRLGLKLGFSIGVNSFGYGLLIPHYGTIVVNCGIKAGNYCVLHTSTCIGGAGKTIGDGLYMSAGAQIMGKEINLGKNISVAANSLVNKSFPESNCLLVGSPARIKTSTLPWYERDGYRFKERIKTIEELRKKMIV
jgi:serine O-acetyltransferase